MAEKINEKVSEEMNTNSKCDNKKVSVDKKNELIKQGSILAVAGIIVRMIGLLYRIPMANLLGAEGNGIYSVAFGIYNIALTLSSYSLPLAVSKLMSHRLAKKEYKNAYHVFRNAFIFAVISGTIACSFIYFGAGFFETLYAKKGLAIPLRVVAPTTFIMAMLGVFRGLFQGKSTMVPTAVSQIVEQIINAGISVFAAYELMKIYSTSVNIAAFGAAGGICGTLAGAFSALLFLVLLYFVSRKTMMRQKKLDQTKKVESNRQIYKILIVTTIPVILSQTVYQIGYTIDDIVFGNIMQLKGMEGSVISSLQGVFNSQYNLLINVPVAIASAMAASTIPSITSSRALRKKQEVKDKISSVKKFNMVIAFPAAVGLMVLAYPIMTILFPSIIDYRSVAVNLMIYGSFAVVFYSLSTITSAILQALNYMRIPVIHSAVSLVVHVAIIVPLLYFTNMNVYALLIGNVTFPLIVSILNWRSVAKYANYNQEVKKTFVFPLIGSGIMGVIVYGSYTFIYSLTGILIIGLAVSMVLGTLVYGIFILKIGCFSKMELKEIPMGGHFIKFVK